MSADGYTLVVDAQEEGGSATGVNGDQNDNSADDSGAVYLVLTTLDLTTQEYGATTQQFIRHCASMVTTLPFYAKTLCPE